MYKIVAFAQQHSKLFYNVVIFCTRVHKSKLYPEIVRTAQLPTIVNCHEPPTRRQRPDSTHVTISHNVTVEVHQVDAVFATRGAGDACC